MTRLRMYLMLKYLRATTLGPPGRRLFPCAPEDFWEVCLGNSDESEQT
jgi:hypothetical protein